MTILNGLDTLIDEWSQRIILQSIWFVDRPAERYRLEAKLRQHAPDLFVPPVFPTFGPHLAGVPVYEWSSAQATADEWRRWPWIVLYPGVWLKFSDGVYARRG